MNEIEDPQSSGEVAEEAESARAGLAETLGNLRDNLTTGHIAEEVLGNAQAGVTALLNNVAAAAREHPFPAALIGAGVTMMFGIGARSAVGARDRGDRRSGQFWPSASNPKPNESRSRSLPIGRLGVQDPLVIAAIGIAVGAAIGAVLPASATENELMGTMSSSARRAAREVAEDEMKHLKDSVSRTVESVKQSAAERGLSSDNLSEAVRAAGEQVKAAAHEAIADAGQPKTEK